MSLPWFKVYRGAVDHPKVFRLASALGVSPNEARGLLWRFWDVIASYYPEGVINGDFVSEITDRLGVNGPEFWSALARADLVDKSGKHWEVHGWIEHNGAIVRETLAKKGRKRRAQSSPNPRVRQDKTRQDKKNTPATRKRDCPVAGFAAAWNEHTEPPIPRIRDPQGKIRELFAARSKETHNGRSFAESWPEVCRRVQASGLCRGERGNGWIAKPRDILRPGRWQEIMDGAFLDASEASKLSETDPTAIREKRLREAAALRELAQRNRARGYGDRADEYDQQAELIEAREATP